MGVTKYMLYFSINQNNYIFYEHNVNRKTFLPSEPCIINHPNPNCEILTNLAPKYYATQSHNYLIFFNTTQFNNFVKDFIIPHIIMTKLTQNN